MCFGGNDVCGAADPGYEDVGIVGDWRVSEYVSLFLTPDRFTIHVVPQIWILAQAFYDVLS